MVIDNVENGEAPYTIPALVVDPCYPFMPAGSLVMVRQIGNRYEDGHDLNLYEFEHQHSKGALCFNYLGKDLILNPTPEQIKAAALVNEAKAGA